MVSEFIDFPNWCPKAQVHENRVFSKNLGVCELIDELRYIQKLLSYLYEIISCIDITLFLLVILIINKLYF